MRVRRATVSDVDVVVNGVDQYRDCVQHPGSGLVVNIEEARRYFTMALDNPLFVFLVAEDNSPGIIIGGILAAISPWQWNPSQFVMNEMIWWVFPEYRSGGYGVMLHRALESVAREMGIQCLFMNADQMIGNVLNLHEYYTNCGYSLFGTKYALGLGED